MLLLLWVLEILLLDTIYKHIKTNSIIHTGEFIAENINHPGFSQTIDQISMSSDVCVVIYNENMNLVYKSDASKKCSQDILNKDRVLERIYNASINNDTFTEEVKTMEIYDFGIMKRAKSFHEIQYTQIVNQVTPYYLLMNTLITPLDATVDTLKTILMIVTFGMSGVAIILGYYISKKISKPIQQLNEAAKHLGKGDVIFTGEGYLEIEELSQTLNQANDDLHQVEKLRNELISNISHDLKTPLTMISGYAEMMRDLPDENNEENLNVIIDETKYLTRLVNDVLDLSKLQAGAQKLTPSVFDLTQMMNDIIERVKTLSDIPIEFDYDQSIEVKADEMKISQVFYNILNNALHYTKDKVIVRQIVEKDKIRIEIQDNGEGIAEEEIDHIWECYYRSKNHQRQVSGTGLGLYICKQILDLHHASYGVQSHVHQGSLFYFELTKNMN